MNNSTRFLFRRIAVCIPALFICLCCSSELKAGQQYSLTTTQAPYQELGSSTLISDTFDTELFSVNLPFTLKLFGNTFDLDDDGNDVAVTRSGYFAVIRSDTSLAFAMDAFLSSLGKKDATSALSYSIREFVDERILIFQWKNMNLEGNPAGDYVNFQLWFYETSGDVEVRIGPHQATGTAAFSGNTGPAIGMFTAPGDFSVSYDVAYLFGNAANPALTNSGSGVFHALQGVPQEGTVYTIHTTTTDVPQTPTTGSSCGIFPNTIEHTAHIALPDELRGRSADLILYDMLGQEVRHLYAITDGLTFSKGNLPKGLYFYAIRNEQRIYATGSVMIP